jgi:hypothetical protein
VGAADDMACDCGHVWDEHSASGECQIDGCRCAGFEGDGAEPA